jgi:hypothetical protein
MFLPWGGIDPGTYSNDNLYLTQSAQNTQGIFSIGRLLMASQAGSSQLITLVIGEREALLPTRSESTEQINVSPDWDFGPCGEK